MALAVLGDLDLGIDDSRSVDWGLEGRGGGTDCLDPPWFPSPAMICWRIAKLSCSTITGGLETRPNRVVCPGVVGTLGAEL